MKIIWPASTQKVYDISQGIYYECPIVVRILGFYSPANKVFSETKYLRLRPAGAIRAVETTLSTLTNYLRGSKSNFKFGVLHPIEILSLIRLTRSFYPGLWTISCQNMHKLQTFYQLGDLNNLHNKDRQLSYYIFY